MTDYEVEYDNSGRVPDADAIFERWKAASAAYRDATHAELDLKYGAGDRHRYDLFPADGDAPLVVYIHGGYWQGGDRTLYSFLAEALNANGLTLAVPSYSLCPSVSVLDIVGELRMFLVALWKRTRVRPLVVGHSAGGHLTAAMLAVASTDLAGGIAISGIFDLQPLVSTSINGALGLDLDTARQASPSLWPPPPPGRALTAAVGADESSEFLRQSRELVESWGAAGAETEYLEVPGTNHFTVVDELTQPRSLLSKRVVAMAQR